MTIAEAPFTLIDTETAGVEKGDDLLEVAAVSIQGERAFETYVRATKPIPPQASAIHHIVDADVADAPERADALVQLRRFLDPEAILVAHNAEFDRGVLSPELDGRRWLCTMRLARHLVPDAPAFSNAALWYYLGGHKITGAMHRAQADLVVTRFVFEQLLERYFAFVQNECAGDAARLAKAHQVATLIAFSERQYTIAAMPFGKYKGVALSQLPADYLRWGVSAAGPSDPAIRWNLERELARRQGRAA